MINRPAFKEHLDVRVIPSVGVLVFSEKDQHVLEGDLYPGLVPLLDGHRTAEEIAAQLGGLATAEQVFFALMQLERWGFLKDGPPVSGSPTSAYWLNAGQDPDAAIARIAAMTIRVEAVGDVPLEGCKEAFKRHGLRVDDAGTLRVVLADHYLHPGLGDLNAATIVAREPWILARLVGSEPWIGPAFVPGRTPCWECLAHRLRGNMPVHDLVRLRSESGRPPAHRGALPSTIDLAAGLLSTAAQAWIVSGGETFLSDTLIALDTATLVATMHRVDRRPQCPACGDSRMYAQRVEAGIQLVGKPARFSTDGGYRVVSPASTVRRFEQYVSPITGVIRDVKRVTVTEGTPMAVWTASHSGPALAHPFAKLYRLPGVGSAGGKGRTEVQARASVLGEAIERVSGLYQGDEPSIAASLATLGGDAIHPNACMLYSESQYATRNVAVAPEAGYHAVPPPLPDAEVLEWSPVWSLTEARPKYLPTMYLYFAHPTRPERMFCPADSNGNACGNTLEEAILQGCLELVERDAVGIWWYNRIARPRLELADIDDAGIHELIAWYGTVGRTVHVLDLSTDLGIPAYAAVSTRLEREDEILLGFGAHLDPHIAAGRALTELNQMYALVEVARVEGDLNPDMKRWLAEATVANQPHVAPADSIPVSRLDFSNVRHRDVREAVLDCQQRIEGRGLELLVLDQTRPDLRIPVVKVIVPGLRHFWARFAWGRLYQVPTTLNWLQRPPHEDAMNPLPLFV